MQVYLHLISPVTGMHTLSLDSIRHEKINPYDPAYNYLVYNHT
uniref:Uncharacterized protein n=1 Tax=Rhizophora mucronata TaxID=61149 RepID=A0A2P2NBQ8_RHIMU